MSARAAATPATRGAPPASLRTAAGRSVALGPEIARGGEASVHVVVGSPSLLAKVYTAPRPSAGDKLRWMQGHPPRERSGVVGHFTIAWPSDLLLDRAGACVGYLMPRIADAAPLLDVMNPRRRAKVLPAFDHAYVLRTARNLAAAIASLHDCGTVVGDLHERNVLVTRRALVTVIDADSFQVTRVADDTIVIHPCPVGRSEYTPPELQGQAFRTVVREPAHDAFGLAVLVFQLLHGGSHPFRGRWSGGGEAPSVEEKIRRGWFPWAAPTGVPVAPPPGVPPLSRLDPGVRQAMLGTFVEGHARPAARPSAADWERVLGQAEADLAVCPAGHTHPGHLRRCPICGAWRGGWTGLVGRLGARVPAPAASRPAANAPRTAAPSPVMPRAERAGTRPAPAAATPSATGNQPGGGAAGSTPVGTLARAGGAGSRLSAAAQSAADGAGRVALAIGLAAVAAGSTALIHPHVTGSGAIALVAATFGHAAGVLAGSIAPGALRQRALDGPIAAAVATSAALACGWIGAAALPWLLALLAGGAGSPGAPTGLAFEGSSTLGAGSAWVLGFGIYGALNGRRAGRWDGWQAGALVPPFAAGAAGWLAAWCLGQLVG